MKSFKKHFFKYFSFMGGLVMGLTLMSLSHAALPNRATPSTGTARQKNTSLISEMKGGKVNSPELDRDFSNLNNVEGKYAESWDQQQRLKNATARISRAPSPTKRKSRR